MSQMNDRETTLAGNLSFLVGRGYITQEEAGLILNSEINANFSKPQSETEEKIEKETETESAALVERAKKAISTVPDKCDTLLILGAGAGSEAPAVLENRPNIGRIAIVDTEPARYREIFGKLQLWKHPEIIWHLWIGDVSNSNIERFKPVFAETGEVVYSIITNQDFIEENEAFIERFNITKKVNCKKSEDEILKALMRLKDCFDAKFNPDISMDFLFQRFFDLGHPTIFRIEPTNFCNLQCSICPTCSVPRHQRGFMDFSLYEGLIDGIRAFNPEVMFYLILYLGGEPLMHKQIGKMVEKAARSGFYTHINTNGTLMTEALAEELISSGLMLIKFSIDDMPPEEFNRIRKGSDYWQVYNNLKMFVEVKERMKTNTPEIRIAALQKPEPQTPADGLQPPEPSDGFRKLFENLPVRVELNRIHNWASDFDAGIGCEKHTRVESYFPCKTLWYDMTIRWDGTVVPCCYDLRGEVPLGKYPENSLREIWEGRAYTALRQDHLAGRINNIALCRGCLGNKKQPILEYILGEAAHLYRCNAK